MGHAKVWVRKSQPKLLDRFGLYFSLTKFRLLTFLVKYFTIIGTVPHEISKNRIPFG
jgi:hypothetical protein